MCPYFFLKSIYMSDIKSVVIKKSDQPKKRYTAVFTRENGRKKTINFGSKGAKTFIDGAGSKVKSAWEARHIVREYWNNPLTAGALSKHILWGDSDNISRNIVAFKKKFNL